MTIALEGRPAGRLTSGPVLWGTLVLGVLVTAGVSFVDPVVGAAGALVGSLMGIQIAIGAAIFLAIFGVTASRWWKPVVPIANRVAATLPVPAIAILSVFLLGGLTMIYPWTDPDVVAHSHLLHEKHAYLNIPFFLGRAAGVLFLWLLMTAMLRRATASGDRTRIHRWSAGYILVFALTMSVAAWDWVMSIEPEWFSTMFGVYLFIGSFVAGICVITLAMHWPGRPPVAPKVRHDLAKAIFAFTFFWAYIWFCQFMLIWYANVPEETPYFVHRTTGGWPMLFWLLPVVHFALPFLVLMTGKAKRHIPTVVEIAIVVLLARFLDTWLMIGPSIDSSPHLPITAVTSTAAVLAGMVLWDQFSQKRKSANATG